MKDAKDAELFWESGHDKVIDDYLKKPDLMGKKGAAFSDAGGRVPVLSVHTPDKDIQDGVLDAPSFVWFPRPGHSSTTTTLFCLSTELAGITSL